MKIIRSDLLRRKMIEILQKKKNFSFHNVFLFVNCALYFDLSNFSFFLPITFWKLLLNEKEKLTKISFHVIEREGEKNFMKKKDRMTKRHWRFWGLNELKRRMRRGWKGTNTRIVTDGLKGRARGVWERERRFETSESFSSNIILTLKALKLS